MRKTPFLLLVVFVFNGLFAIPANPEPAIVTCPDGSNMMVFLRGDEYHSWHETDDGVDIIKNKDGVFEYVQVTNDGTIKASGIIAHAPGQRDQSEIDYISSMPANISYPLKMPKSDYSRRSTKMLTPSATSDYTFEQTTFPTLGDVKFLVIMVEFQDKRFRHSRQSFDDLMNAENYTYNGAIGSVRKYFNATSFDRFNPHFDVIGPVTADNGYAYYGANLANGTNDYSKTQEMIREAIIKADSQIDYSQYDNDNDGYVDNIYVFFAGYSEANVNADENTIWPHRSSIGSDTPTLDGKKFYDYSVSQELMGTTGTIRSSIAVVCHEFSHVLGLWDYYDTDYSGSGGNALALGYWDLMSNGGYIDNGNLPPIHNAWSRMFLKWAEPVELLHPENVIINPAYSHNEVRYFHSPTDGEFFFLENRQQGGWDQGLFGHGMLIYHIDKNNNGWYTNSINCNPNKQGFDLEEAMGDTCNSYHYADMDPFPGRTNNTSFTDQTNPNAIDWAGNHSNAPIANIQEVDGVISFVFKNADVDMPGDVKITALGFYDIMLNWTLNSVGDSVIILWSADENIAHPESMKRYDVNELISETKVVYKGIDTSFQHVGLEMGSKNYYAIYSFSDSAHIYSARVLRSISTQSPILSASSFGQGLPRGWQAIGVDSLSCFSTENTQGRTLASSSSNDGFMIIDCGNVHSGDSIKADLLTGSYNLELCQTVVVKFQHRLVAGNTTVAQFLYSINGGLSWNNVKTWTEDTQNPECYEVNLDNELAGQNDVRFKFSFSAVNEKYWCIDDFEIYSVVKSGLSSGFYANTIIGYKPLTVEFINTSTCKPDSADSYIWEFGDDGNFYFEKEPSHTYINSGVYDVLLLANKGEETSSCTKNRYIIVLNHAPELLDDDFDTLDVKIGQAITYNLKEIFVDPDGDAMSFSCTNIPANINPRIENDTLLILDPDDDYSGSANLDLIAVDSDNDSLLHRVKVWVSETNTDMILPQEFSLEQNYPNPFNPVTLIKYQLPFREEVKLDVYNLMGQKVHTLIDNMQEAGYYTLKFNANNLTSGVYLYRLTAGNEVITKKMVLMK